VELDMCLFNSSQHWTDTYISEDFFLTSQFPDFRTPPVGGFINNILRGLLRINYELCTYIMPLSRSFNFDRFIPCLDMTSEVLADNEDLLHQLSAELGLGALLQDPGPAQVSDLER
jgi:hypothetical protein